jgi:hypothetical protein
MRLLGLTVRNFRGFGPAVDEIDLDADLILGYGPNGHGKTSLAEAIEWLFYGTTKRRLRGDDYSKAEYANTFANAHGGIPTEVTVRVLLEGQERVLSRRLANKETSRTFVDGQPMQFEAIGVQAVEACYPVVAQHGLQTFVHSKPKDRRDAICAALGLDELTVLKSALESARGSFQRSPPVAVAQARAALRALASELAANPATVAVAKRWTATPATVDAPADISALLTAAGALVGVPQTTPADALAGLRAVRAGASRAVLDLTPVQILPEHSDLQAAALEKLGTLLEAVVAVDDAVGAVAAESAATHSAALLSFWNEGLNLAPVGPDCPMCEAPTLTPGRRNLLRERLDGAVSVLRATAALEDALGAWQVASAAAAAAVAALGLDGLQPTARITLSLLLSKAATVPDYLAAHDAFLLARRNLGIALRNGRELGQATRGRSHRPDLLPALVEERLAARQALASAIDSFAASIETYAQRWREVEPKLGARIDADVTVSAIDAIGRALQAEPQIARLARYAQVLEETQVLIRAVEGETQAKQQALLQSRGLEVKNLYSLLNPGTPVGFEAMEPANDAMRLHATSFGVRMSAAANLSECQLNCLGLAVWLVRAITPGSPFGFVLLDDPVQAMDDDHAEAFVASVVPHLLDQAGKQVVVLSHVKGVVDRLRYLNQHRDLRLYHYENYERGGPVIILQQRLQQALAEIKGAANGNEANRNYAVDRLRVLIEMFVRELHLIQTGSPIAANLDTANSGQLADVFRQIPGTDPAEHNGLRDTIRFCDPAHHTQAGYAVPLKSNIQPHIDRVAGLIKKYGLIH